LLITTARRTSSQLSFQQKNISEEKENIVSSPTMVLAQCPIKSRDNMLVEKIQPRQQQVCDSLPLTKKQNFSNKACISPRFGFRKFFPLFPGNSTQWRQFIPNEGGLIQVDIGGHQPIPTRSCCHSLFQHVLLYLFVIMGSTLLGPSESLRIFQVDTGGLPPNPADLIWDFSCQHIFLYFEGHFGALNNVFLRA
jgi:hypothetical protein